MSITIAPLDQKRHIRLTILVLEWFLLKTKNGDMAINACDSTPDKAKDRGGWLKQWLERYGCAEIPPCSVKTCTKRASCGAHIRLLRGRQEFAAIYIVPMCSSCNNRTGYGNSAPPKMPLRKNVKLMSSNLRNMCRYRCKNGCRYKQQRKHFWFKFRRRIFSSKSINY